MKSLNLDVNGMSCGGCVRHVRDALNAQPGVKVKDVVVSGAEGYFDDTVISVERIIAAVRAAGYEVSGVSANAKA